MPYLMINLGGVAIGVMIVVVFLIRWWFAEKHRPGGLVPFVLSFLYGMLASLAAIGSVSALGIAAWTAVWTANVSGYAALVWGVGGTAPDVTRSQQLVLTAGGYVIVLVLSAVLFALWRWAPRVPNWKLFFGAFAGASVALSGNVAGVAAIPLGSTANLLGSGFTAAFG